MIHSYIFTVPASEEDRITAELFLRGAMSVSRVEKQNSVQIDVQVDSESNDAVKELFKSYKYEEKIVEEKDWKNEWVSDFKGISIDGVWEIISAENTHADRNSRTIIIDPRNAFGAGTHPTTAMCLLLLDQVKLLCEKNTMPLSIFDIGTGSGILAIAAAKIGFTSVSACDIETDAVDMAKENAAYNHIESIVFFQGDAGAVTVKPVSCVVANLQTAIIEKSITHIKNLVSKDGYLIISGCDKKWESSLLSLFKSEGLHVIKESERDGWLAFILTV